MHKTYRKLLHFENFTATRFVSISIKILTKDWKLLRFEGDWDKL